MTYFDRVIDLQTNITLRANIAASVITDKMLAVAEELGPGLKHDGIFFVGLDTVGFKIIEINTATPGLLYAAGRMTGIYLIVVRPDSIGKKG